MSPLTDTEKERLHRQNRVLILRVAASVAIACALIAIIPTYVGFTLYRNVTNDRLRDNQQVTQAIARFAFEQCVDAELRDVVYAQWGGALLTISRRLDQSNADIRRLVQVLEDGIATLEPPDERDCVPPLEEGKP